MGAVSGETFTFSFENYAGSKGKGEMTLPADGSLKGWWTEDGDSAKYILDIRRK